MEHHKEPERPQGTEDMHDSTEVVRHEERLSVTKDLHEQGAVRVHKRVETEHIDKHIVRQVEEAEVERKNPNPDDSGEVETLADGSISIPILEEELVITKRIVVRERIIIRKHVRTEQTQVEAELRREHVEVEADPGVEIEGGAST